MTINHIRTHLKQICYVSIDEFGTSVLLNRNKIEICKLNLGQFDLISSEYLTLQMNSGYSENLLYLIVSK